MVKKSKLTFQVVLMVALGIGIALAVLGTLFMWLIGAGRLNLFEIFTSVIVLVLVAGASWFFVDKYKCFKRGMPLEDERMKQATQRAGYYAFIVAIWTAVFAGFSEGFLEVGQATGLVVLASAIVFIGLAIYFIKTGK
jgi:hypothetical protein